MPATHHTPRPAQAYRATADKTMRRKDVAERLAENDDLLASRSGQRQNMVN